jgi:TolB protein
VRRLAVFAALAALLVTGCGGSSKPKGPPDLLFVSTRDGDYAIFGADAKGDGVHRLTDEKGDTSSPAGLYFQNEPAWSPDGTRIAFVSSRDGHSHVFTMSPDGTGTKRLTDSNQNDDHPSWSPDGRWIVFAREGAIFRVPAAGGKATRVGKGRGAAADPAYSPDGSLIAYDYREPGFSIRELYVMRADGTGVRKLTDLREVSSYPTWSPDGKRVAFLSNAFTGHAELFVVPVAGGTAKRVTTSDLDAIQPAWGPNGELAFSRDGAIWMTVDGEETQLTSGDHNDSAPAWRPLTSQ